jgi:pimeloyl-ACP methyl ester carboxylesterase
MPSIDVDGIELHYDVHGEGEPLLCLMGLGADSTAWALQVPAWSPHLQVITLDNRDVGRSGTASGPYDVADMAADALGVADHLGLESFHLLGLSMGGMIAQEIALAAPERVRTLQLVVTYAGAGRWGREKARIWTEAAKDRTYEQMVDELLLLCVSEAFYENESAVKFLKDLMLQNPNPQSPEAFARQLDAASRHEARDRVGALSMPVHVIGGEHDVLVPVWKSRELAALVPGATFTEVPGGPHGLNLERAEELNAAVLDFVRTHTPAAA